MRTIDTNNILKFKNERWMWRKREHVCLDWGCANLVRNYKVNGTMLFTLPPRKNAKNINQYNTRSFLL